MNISAARFSATEEAPGPKYAILVADDDPTSRLLAGAALEEAFGPVLEAENGLIAVEALQRQRFDLAVVDLDMPVMDGFGVIERARADPKTEHLPIIVVTGRDDVVAIERAFALGATSFLCKPLNWNVFRHQVRYVLEVARDARESRLAKERAEMLSAIRELSYGALENRLRQSLAKIDAAAGRLDQGRAAQDIIRASAELAEQPARIRGRADILSGAVPFEPKFISARDLLAHVVKHAEVVLGASLRDRVKVDADASQLVRCDPVLATEALTEILINALTFSPADKVVSIKAAVASGERIRFEIADQGPGIPEYMLAEGFGTIGHAIGAAGRSSCGLGLPTAKAVLDRHGGHLGVMSEFGVRTEVFLTFPADQGHVR